MSVGKINEFSPTNDWKLYCDRLEQYFIANGVAQNLHVPILVTVMGAESYELLANLCTPTKPSTLTFVELCKKMENHLQPKPSLLSERYKFRHRKQNDGESVSEYTALLKKMSKTCQFDSTLQENLRDQLVCGLKSGVIRQRLFTEEKLDFVKAYNLAVSMEAAEKDAALVEDHGSGTSAADSGVVSCQAVSTWHGPQGRAALTELAAVEEQARAQWDSGQATNNNQRRRSITATAAPASVGRRQCNACGGDHEEMTCKYGRSICRMCSRQGHLRRVCPALGEFHNMAASGNNHSEDSDELQIL